MTPPGGGTAALVAAAGRGSRLGAEGPKILLPLAPGLTLWDALASGLGPHVDRIHVVLSPAGVEPFQRHLAGVSKPGAEVTLGVQDPPRGMGDAIFGAREAWRSFASLLVVWGDQAGLSEATVRRTLSEHACGEGARLTLPLVSVERPYVQYLFEPSSGALSRVLQTREGNPCDARGDADVGMFCLSTAGLPERWDAYERGRQTGASTGEINFLPFLAQLSTEHGVGVRRVAVTDPVEARGINTPEDLAFFRRRFTAPDR